MLRKMKALAYKCIIHKSYNHGTQQVLRRKSNTIPFGGISNGHGAGKALKKNSDSEVIPLYRCKKTNLSKRLT